MNIYYWESKYSKAITVKRTRNRNFLTLIQSFKREYKFHIYSPTNPFLRLTEHIQLGIRNTSTGMTIVILAKSYGRFIKAQLQQQDNSILQFFKEIFSSGNTATTPMQFRAERNARYLKKQFFRVSWYIHFDNNSTRVYQTMK